MSIRQIVTSKRFVAAATIPATVLASGALVMASSYSAFSAKTDNAANNWATGTVNLTDDDNGAALFTTGSNAGNLKPGSTGSKCIVVSSTGSLASAVKVYAKDYSQTKGLGDNLNLKVEEGTGGSFNNCTGFTSESVIFNDTATVLGGKTTYNGGVGTWTPAGATTANPVTKTYKVTYKVSDTAPDTAQGGTASIALVWETQNS